MQCAASFASADFDLEAAPRSQEPCPPRLRAQWGIRAIGYLLFRCGSPGAAAHETLYAMLFLDTQSFMRARAGRCFPTEIAEPNTVRLFLLLALSRYGRRMLLKRQACVVGSNAR
jgi:hypothetical protein